MSKLSLFATSIVPACLAGFLCFLLAMAFVNHFEGMPTALQAVAGITLLAAAAVALLPVAILVMGPKQTAKNAKKSGKSGEVDEAASVDDLEADEAYAEDFETEEAEAASADDLFVEGEADEFTDLEMDEFPEDEGKVK